MPPEQIAAIEKQHQECAAANNYTADFQWHVYRNLRDLCALARRALELEERMSIAIRFKFAAGEHWSNDIDICRCEGHLLPKQPYMWAVRQGGNVLGKSGDWMYEPLPSSRGDEFYAEYRFNTYEDAEKAAANCTPLGAINNARRGM